MTDSKLLDLRMDYHKKICANILGHRPGSQVYSNADKDNPVSVALAAGIAAQMGHPVTLNPPAGQAAGAQFGLYTKEFLEASFKHLQHIRPGEWLFSASQQRPGIAQFEQYEHLAELVRVLEQHKDLKAALGGDYLITPDITIARRPLTDAQINAADIAAPLVTNEEEIAKHTPLRVGNRLTPQKILHASVSCKWTIRSDRSQNSRTEALNLIRNRKGKTPYIAVVIFEPLPSRIASIAMGTGDIDCTYHGALYELLAAAHAGPYPDALDTLNTLVNGRRLRDISDLPFDLAA